MKIYFDKSKRPEPSKIYLATSDHRILCALNGIDESSCYFTANLNDAYEISFDINRYINIAGRTVESNGYHLINVLMRLYVTNIGWFIISPPSVHNDGIKEIKSIKAQSVEVEMMQHDMKNLKINKGTSDSYEMLVEGNVDKIDDAEFAKEHIKFCNPLNPKLSLLHILLRESGLYNWKIGHIDDVPKAYQYYDNGVLKERLVKLSDEVGTFDIESQNLYSFLTQDAAQFFSCLFIFDRRNLTINAYRPENLGRDTNINIGFRNLQQSNQISVDENNIYTRYSVSGSDDLGIQYVNFGSNIIENISGYFLNEKYMPADLIEKYSLWQNDIEKSRAAYMESTRKYNEQLKIISELHDRVPLDDCSTDWSAFPDDRLLEAQANYQAQLKGYESFYVDENGDFDIEALDASSDANDYYQIRDVILPSIQIEIDNRNLPDKDDETEYIKTYETDWKLYGLDELAAKLETYKNIVKVCESGNYHVPYTEDSGHTEDYHNEMYQKYLDAQNQLNGDFLNSCQEAYDQRKGEVDEASDILNQHDTRRKEIAHNIQKETWHNEDYSFTEADLACLSKLYLDTDYTNNNMFLTASDDSVSAIDEQLKLLHAAQEDLYSASQPQYIYTTDLDNFLAKYEYKNYIDNLNLGDFLYLGIRDDYVVKLRTISMKYNPLLMKNDLQITFSNMVKGKSSRNDLLFLLDTAGNRRKHSSVGGSGDFLSNEGVSLTPGLIQKLLQNGAFKSSVDQMIENGMAVNGNKIILGTGSLSVSELNSKLIEAVNISGENGFFEYLQAKLISADRIIADSGKFLDLSSLVARIDSLLAGNVSAELGHLIKITAENVEIDEAVIRDLIAAQITVSMLQADTISSDKFNIESDDGGMTIAGNTMQFKDAHGNLRIQIGRDADNNFTFVLYDETGTGVLMDSTGIKPSAISDGIIQNNMIAQGSITKDRLGFKVVDTDENGKVCITEILDENGQSLGVSYKEIQKTITEFGEQMESFTTLSETVDKTEKAISEKVWQTEIDTAINDYDNSSIKTIRDTVAEHKTSIGAVTDKVASVETALETKADGSAVRTLSEKVSEIEQDQNGFKQTVSSTYATKDEVSSVQSALTQKDSEIEGKITAADGRVTALTADLEGVTGRVADAEGNISVLTEKSNEIEAQIENTKDEIASVRVTADNISSTVAKKQDMPFVSIRYIRDWLNGSSSGSLNHWLECQVSVDGTNIARGLVPAAKDTTGETIDSVERLSCYTNESLNISDCVTTNGNGEWQCLQLDLGKVRGDIDCIRIWHNYTDGQAYNHRLQVSENGSDWITLFNSDIQGTYQESEKGKAYYLNDSSILENFSSIRQDISSVTSQIQDESAKIQSIVSQTQRDFGVQIESLQNNIENVEIQSDELSQKLESAKAEMLLSIDSFLTRLTSIEKDLKLQSEVIQTSEGWKLIFKKIGMYDGSDVPDQETYTNIDIDGIEVSNPIENTKATLKTDGIKGYYNNEVIFQLQKDATVTERLYAKRGIDTYTMKMIPVAITQNSVTKSGVAFVRSGGDS